MKRLTGLVLSAVVFASGSGCEWLPFRTKPSVVAPKMDEANRLKPVKAESINKTNAYEKAKQLDDELSREEMAVPDN